MYSQQFPTTMMVPNSYVPPPEKIRIEEILRMLLYVPLGVYMVAHMLIIPIEVLVIALIQDPYFKAFHFFIYSIFVAKYVCVGIMFYCAHHHTNLWLMHSHWLLYFFATICLLVTGFFGWFVIETDYEMRKHGFGPIIDHPFYYDFIGFTVCGVLGCIYIFYLGCTKPPMQYSFAPMYDPYMLYKKPRSPYQMANDYQYKPIPSVETQPMPVQPELKPEPKVEEKSNYPTIEEPTVFQPAYRQPIRQAKKVPIYFVPSY